MIDAVNFHFVGFTWWLSYYYDSFCSGDFHERTTHNVFFYKKYGMSATFRMMTDGTFISLMEIDKSFKWDYYNMIMKEQDEENNDFKSRLKSSFMNIILLVCMLVIYFGCYLVFPCLSTLMWVVSSESLIKAFD